MPGLPARALALTALAAVLLGCSSSCHAGDQASRQWDEWVDEHPLTGAEVTETVSRNVQPFQGTFTASARLTAAASEPSIVAAMASMCRFDDETSSSTTYWLQVDRISLQAPCTRGGQEKVARFWSAVHDSPGSRRLAFSSRGVVLTADDASLTRLVQPVSDAADLSGRATSGTLNEYSGPHVAITQARGWDLTDEARFTQGVLDAAGPAVRRIQVVAGRVSASTTGTVEEARAWEREAGQGAPALTVTPARITTEVPLTARGRDLLERLSADRRVLAVAVIEPFWSVDVPSTRDARGLIDGLDRDRGVPDLGDLHVYAGTEPYESATGTGRSCFVRPEHPERAGRAEALLDLCDLKPAVLVDDRFDVSLSLRWKSEDLVPLLRVLRRMPFGQEVYLQLPQSRTVSFTTGAELVPEFPQAELSKELVTLWDRLG